MNKRNYVLNAKCPKCGEWLSLSLVDGYPLSCPDCDEDFYSIEVHEICGDWFEVTIDISFNEYKSMLESIKDNFKDVCFIAYDDKMKVCDIGFEEIPSCERVKDIIKFFNLAEVGGFEKVIIPKNIEEEIIEEVSLLKNINDCVGIEIGDDKALFIQVDNYDEDKAYFIELNYIDEDSGWEPCAEYNAISKFGDIDELIETIEKYLDDVL